MNICWCAERFVKHVCGRPAVATRSVSYDRNRITVRYLGGLGQERLRWAMALHVVDLLQKRFKVRGDLRRASAQKATTERQKAPLSVHREQILRQAAASRRSDDGTLKGSRLTNPCCLRRLRSCIDPEDQMVPLDHRIGCE